MSSPPVFKIIPTTQTYDWGKIGLSSKVAQYASASKIPGFSLDDKTPYAELWMGTHPSSPSRLLSDTNVSLASHLADHPDLIGRTVSKQFANEGTKEGNLPFLFKVLAIEKALSIQTHPDKATAKKLHKEKPNVYKDANHKPEMAIALTPFEALCGFRPLPQIAEHLSSTPELASLVPSATISRFLNAARSDTPTGTEEKAALKDLFASIMTADEAVFKESLAKLIQRYEDGALQDSEVPVRELVTRLNSQFPGDIGIYCAFILNYVRLNPGEAIFLAAGEPHAYVSGDILECMATSDNVIRAGLTPKLRDVPNLVSGLTYKSAEVTKHFVEPGAFQNSSPHTRFYNPPIPEFAVLLIKVEGGQAETHPPIDGPSLAVVTEGNGIVRWNDGQDLLGLSPGEVFFVGAGTQLQFQSDGGMTVARAFVDLDVKSNFNS